MRPTLARVLAASVLTLAACSSKSSKNEPPPPAGSASAPAQGSAAAPAQGSAAALATPAPASPAAAPEAPAPGAGGTLPAECDEYRETIRKLAKCGDALPNSTRDNLQRHFDQQWAGWAKLPDQDRRALAAICKSSSDSVRTAAASACGW